MKLNKFRIAYLSYEHPLGAAPAGGIGIYIHNISKLMSQRGHDIEVFSATPGEPSTQNISGYTLHLIPTKTKADFKTTVLPVFEERYLQQAFDLIESPEYGADGLAVKDKYPTLPLAVKLHTPGFLIGELNGYKRSFFDKLRYLLGAAIRLKRVKLYWRYDKESDPEYQLFRLADGVSSPSTSLAQIAGERWGSKTVKVLPNPAVIPDLDPVPENSTVSGQISITFVGRLERRKGVFMLMKAIPQVLKSNPALTFNFVGEPVPSPEKGLNTEEYIKRKLKNYTSSLRFWGILPHNDVLKVLQSSDIGVFPSLWENFPNVCLEAMACGCAVIGTGNGGMADMITDGLNGLLIEPDNPQAIAHAINKLVADANQCKSLGEMARKTILDKYNDSVIGQQTEQFYIDTIAACRK